MANPYIAIHSISNIREEMEKLEENWNLFVFEKREPQSMRMQVYQSWKRCQTKGVNPLQKQSPIVLTDEQLVEWVNQSQLSQVSLPILQDLARQIEDTHYIITLCDNKGRIIHVQGEQKILQKAELMNFVPGSDWSEETAGTNAIGTCIAAKQPIQIFSYEHFCEGAHPWICSAAPIEDPLTGQLLGVIDLTGPCDLAQPHSLGTAVMTAKTIEQRFREAAMETRHYLQACFLQATDKRNHAPILMLDEALQAVAATPNALSLLQLEDKRAFWARSELSPLKSTLFSLNDPQAEVFLPERQLTVSIESVFKGSKRVGFLLHFHKSPQFRPSTPLPANHWADIIGQSKALHSVVLKSQIVAPTDVPVLITGESGTGKERFARAIHLASPRHRAPFLAINCGAVPKELIASELFGYETGTFTGGSPKGKTGKFEEADTGTLFLDEIGEMPLDLQVFLLRVLQEKEIVRLGSSKAIPVNVRIIAATNQNLEQLVKEGKFRSDLYYRLNVVQLALPPLRERGDDVLLLCDHLIQKFAKKHGKRVIAAEDDVLSFLRAYPWPGNIRELENAIEHAVLFTDRERIHMSDLPGYLLMTSVGNPSTSPLEQEEKKLLNQLYRETNGNLSEIARRCNIARTTLYRKLKKYNML
ncbi:sigma-54-dependent Fis family transcriptional regulator [Brevibacillus sp. SYP-B805]|uniref:sigma-54-dependent Fis family transcriptional regulator n=1 Tax=Brevibacillus sp. SYP-B805 TaxID=1578199 RepID=UPI0013EA714D|nr:sigma-54-dependent Fis family transcriptional regulator [Brevibacillus sp. SYP-B805]NGQ95729.1 sigma-54-dependent Fis family transcriptional regulator [Brevibacillus sp. SYP-B805]